ncbi:MAG: hemerythrin family protein, partial [Desulfovibrionales bacterium]|nr:hemerythrin family protein [Desulfovibrionales bacterium]
EHQKKMFEVFNTLIEMKQKKTDAKTITNAISDINDYGKVFFAAEEKLLRRRKYPDFDTHSKAHRQFIKSAISLRREVVEDVANLSLEAVVALRDWLVEHIATSDSLYVPFLRIHQYVDNAKRKN